MKISEVPQDDIPTLKGYARKAVYAVDDNGKYVPVPTSGWSVEEVVLRDVLEDFQENTRRARIRVGTGDVSPIEYFMNKNLMDLPALAGGIGLAQWRVKRHLRPVVFSRLGAGLIRRYAEFFKTTPENLQTLCDEPI